MSLRSLFKTGMSIGIVVFTLGCGNPVEPDEEKMLSWISAGDSASGLGLVVQVPDTVEKGESFDFSVRIYHGGCEEPGEVRVEGDSHALDVFPYTVRRRRPGELCADVLRTAGQHEMLKFDATGVGVVTLHGRTQDGPEIDTVAVPFEVVVR